MASAYAFTPEAFAAAKTLLERALALDPESREANIALSLINHHTSLMGFAPDTLRAMEATYALGQTEKAATSVSACRAVLPEIRVGDLDRVPLESAEKMEELRARLIQASFK